MQHRRRRGATAAVALALTVVAACSNPGSGPTTGAGPGAVGTRPDPAPTARPAGTGPRPDLTTSATSGDGRVRLRTLSTRADLVTGGDVLIGIDTPEGTAMPAGIRVAVDGSDVTSRLDPDTGVGVVPVGPTSSTITADDGETHVELTVTDHPTTGPVISGPHQTPFACTTDRLGLAAATDADCSAPTRVRWRVKTPGGLVPLADPTALPPDTEQVSVDGRSVPFVVREEQGVINRSVYWISALDPAGGNPAAGATPGTPGTPGTPAPRRTATGEIELRDGARAPRWDTTGLNHRLVYTFGGGCGTSFSQGAPLGTGADTGLLAQGYTVATATFNTFQVACNDVLSAETALMVREHAAEMLGPFAHTIGQGGSGGAIQQLLIAQNYTGLLDAIAPALPFPDAITIAAGVTDCGLLLHYYGSDAGSSLNDEQRAAIAGQRSSGTCAMWSSTFLGGVNPTDGCDATLSTKGLVYDPETNPTGARCTLQDSAANTYGRDPVTGFARRPLDNVGVQYGLEALNRKVVDVDQFLDLNEHIGGYDIDGRLVDARHTASEDAVRDAYANGRVTSGGGLVDVPIVLTNVYNDDRGDIHDRFRAFSVRDRLRVAGAQDRNVVVWTVPGTGDLVTSLTGAISDPAESVALLDRWLTAAAADGSTDAWAVKLARARPAEMTDRCATPDGHIETGDGANERAPCAEAFPRHGDPRTAAGAPLRDDILKCSLTGVDIGRYKVPFTDVQQARLARVFPRGVCDWSRPGIGQVALRGTWLGY